MIKIERSIYLNKIIVVKDDIKRWITEEGISVIGLQEFLLNKDSLDL